MLLNTTDTKDRPLSLYLIIDSSQKQKEVLPDKTSELTVLVIIW